MSTAELATSVGFIIFFVCFGIIVVIIMVDMVREHIRLRKNKK